MAVVCDLNASHGHYLRDAISGTDYLDFFGFFASRPLAFDHPKLCAPEFVERLGAVARHKPSNCDVYTSEYATFVDLFGRVVLGGDFVHVFFIDGGGPAVDNAVKAAIDWKVRKNLGAGRGEVGRQIIHFKQAFHGRTGYALSLTDSFDLNKTRYFPKWDWPRISNPKIIFPLSEESIAAAEERETEALGEIALSFERHGDDIAAVIIEPIQCEGGDNYFRSEFLRQLRRLCDEREVLLIFDEVQTGFGATGKWWDWRHHDVRPDILIFGKKTQVCGMAATGRLDEVDSVFSVSSRISSTFTGNIVDMVRVQRVIEIIEEERLLDNAITMGEYLLHVLTEVMKSHPAVRAVRGRGTLAAFDLPDRATRDALLASCFRQELLVLPCGDRSIRFRPSLDISADAIGRAGAQLEAALRHM